jgi:hypothetical protein
MQERRLIGMEFEIIKTIDGPRGRMTVDIYKMIKEDMPTIASI